MLVVPQDRRFFVLPMRGLWPEQPFLTLIGQSYKLLRWKTLRSFSPVRRSIAAPPSPLVRMEAPGRDHSRRIIPMQVLERIWEIIGLMLFGGLGRTFERSLTSLFGSSNARYIKRLQPKVDAINALEPKYQAMSDAELRQQTAEFRRRLAAGETTDDLLVEAFAVCREAGRRWLNMRHYDVQLFGGMVLHSGRHRPESLVTGEAQNPGRDTARLP